MTETPSFIYPLSGGLSSETLLSTLQGRMTLKEEPSSDQRQLYYDSFDWRLYLGGSVLKLEKSDQGNRLVWADVNDETPRQTLNHSGAMYRFAHNFPMDEPIGRELAPLLEMRALMPQLELEVQTRLFHLLDAKGKVVLRFTLEHLGVSNPSQGQFHPLDDCIRLHPIHGHPQALAKMRLLLEEMGLTIAGRPLVERALAALGRKPADYTSKMNYQFESKMSAGEVARAVHLGLLATLERNIPGTRSDLDSEFLHDLRVATRRTRSALTQIKGVFSEQALEAFKPRLAWIGQITGPTRDLDVYLLDFDGYQQSLPPQYQADLEPLRQFLLRHQKEEQRKLAKHLDSKEFRTLLKEWRAFLESPPPEEQAAPNADRPIRMVVDNRIYRVYRKVLAEGLAIDAHSPPEAFHELRKNCKKLRYLLEFFQSLYPRKEVQPLIGTLKQLLSNLGDYQDTEVQAAKLRQFAVQMGQESEVPVYTLLAMGILVDGLLKRQQAAHEAFADRFALFSGRENRSAYKRLFKRRKSS